MEQQLSSFAVGDCYIMKKATAVIGQRMCLDVKNTVSNDSEHLILLFKVQGKTRVKNEGFYFFFVCTIKIKSRKQNCLFILFRIF